MSDLRVLRAFEVRVRAMEIHERYRRNALDYCGAAEKLNAEESGAFIAPISLCLAFAIEFFLKCVLLKAGKATKELSGKSFGHNLWSMWNMPELEVQRQQAEVHAESCSNDLQRDGTALRRVPAPSTFDEYLKDLSKLHSSREMPLRYPIKMTQVPPGTLMICVFDRLIRAEEYGFKTARVQDIALEGKPSVDLRPAQEGSSS